MKPDFITTGFKGGRDDLRSEGWLTITQDGTVLENFHAQYIKVRAKNVTIRNGLIECRGWYGIDADSQSVEDLLIEDVEITFDPKSANLTAAAVCGWNWSGFRLHAHHLPQDAFKMHGGAELLDSYAHHLGSDPKSHADAVQITKGSHIAIAGNNLDLGIKAQPGFNNNQCIQIKPDQGAINDVRIAGNWLNGGGFTVNVDDYNGDLPTDVRITDNLFGRDFRENGAPWRLWDDVITYGNRWEDNGELLPRDVGKSASAPAPAPEASDGGVVRVTRKGYGFRGVSEAGEIGSTLHRDELEAMETCVGFGPGRHRIVPEGHIEVEVD